MRRAAPTVGAYLTCPASSLVAAGSTRRSSSSTTLTFRTNRLPRCRWTPHPRCSSCSMARSRNGTISDERLREEETTPDERLREEETTPDERLREEETTPDEREEERTLMRSHRSILI